MVCTKCGSENIRVGVSVFMYISPEDVHGLTKKVLQKRTTELWSASWDKAQIVCVDCGQTCPYRVGANSQFKQIAKGWRNEK